MKKLLATFIIIFVCFASSACMSTIGTYDEYLWHGTNSNDEYVTALNINLISTLESVDTNAPNKYTAKYIIEIGVKHKALSKSDAGLIIDRISERFDINPYFLKEYYLKQGDDNYVYFAYKVTDVQYLDTGEIKFGFFAIKQYYQLKSRYWVDELRNVVLNKAKEILVQNQSEYVIDEDCARLRYFFVQDTGLKAKGAQKIYKDVLTESEMPSLMWETNSDDYKFTSLELYNSAVASGWFVIAIIAGLAVVLIILLATRKKKGCDQAQSALGNLDELSNPTNDPNVAVGVSQMSFEELSGDPVLHTDGQERLQSDGEVDNVDQAAAPDVLDNQISMDEFIGVNSEE